MAENRSGESKLDVVVFGATGFTGGLITEELAREAKRTPIRVGLAGRNRDKLEKKRAELAARWDLDVPVFVARADDRPGLAAVAGSARVVINAVGPFALHGEPIVSACVEAGTDYVDISGEPDFVGAMVSRHHAAAKAAGLRIVPACGFDCVPADLGVYFLVRELAKRSIPRSLSVEAFMHASGGFSGGTWSTALVGFSRLRSAEYAGPRRESAPGRMLRGISGRPKYVPEVSGWVLPLPSLDPKTVLRSASLDPRYGESFRYGHFLRVGSLLSGAKIALRLGAAVGLAQTKPTRTLLARLKPAGEGPPPGVRARAFFRLTLLGESDDEIVQVRVSGGDAYEETARMCAQSALCLVQDRGALPHATGVITPATAFGDLLLARLDARGTRFEVVRRGEKRPAESVPAVAPAATVGGAA